MNTPRIRIAAISLGLVFGIILCWSGMTSPNVIRDALLFNDSYMYFFMASAVGTATLGLALVKRRQPTAILTGVPVKWSTEMVDRRHIVGGLVFGLGWGISNVCPGPAATQVGQGIGWSLITLTGIVIGVRLYLKREATETEPACDVTAAATSPAPSRTPVTA